MGEKKDTKNKKCAQSDGASVTANIELQENETVKTVQNEHDDDIEDTSDEEMYEKKENKENKLLKEWKLEQYAKILVEDQGYEEIDDWKELTLDDLREFGFKDGHSKRFLRKVDEYFQNMQNKMYGDE